ncbi:unnamed protein product [Polarella glacialis]|uniref:Phospholipase/carboxylesterase/thioesterase domain-containing protein n=1 Tax=Polarella glacialis TaxID=89957 RepID=A0A813GDK3_POLGL|nr:unnamed protein product [Polarella glacialis]
MIVLLHGLDDSAKDCSRGVVASWCRALPDALVAVPQAPHKTEWSDPSRPGFDWVPTECPPPWDTFSQHGRRSKQHKASLKEYRRTLNVCCRDLSSWLDALLCKHGLTNRDLVLVGFSLGAYLSAIVGARRNVGGVIVCGGLASIQELRFRELMPKKSRARFCAVNGTRDSLVHRRSAETPEPLQL